MEIKATYQSATDQAYIRQSTLRPAGQGWEQPSPAEVRAAVARTGLSPREAADFLGDSRKALNRWTNGEEPIPFSAWVVLCQRAGVGFVGDWWL